MKRVGALLMLAAFTFPLFANTFEVKAVKGTVEVRKGVSEEWTTVSVGDILRPEDTMRTGKKSSAVIAFDGKRLTIPEQTMLDLSDFRQMSQEEFLLKLAMENILAVPPREQNGIVIPSVTILHGGEVSKESTVPEANPEVGAMQIQGARVLYDNAFYESSVLKAKETVRKYPELPSRYDARLMIASAFEKLKFYSEALTEYLLLSTEDLPSAKKQQAQSSIARLKKRQ